MSKDDGASADRATHEQSQQAVSAVPVGIPSAVLEAARERLAVRIGYLIRMARIDRGFTLERLAERCGKSDRLIRRLERGDVPNACLGLIAEVAFALGFEFEFSLRPVRQDAPEHQPPPHGE